MVSSYPGFIQQPFLAHEFYSPQTQPGAFVLLWLLPIVALLFLATEIARIWRIHALNWLRFWAMLAACASVLSLGYLFFSQSIGQDLSISQSNPLANARYGFLLICAGLILATIMLLRRGTYISGFTRSRRSLLVTPRFYKSPFLMTFYC